MYIQPLPELWTLLPTDSKVSFYVYRLRDELRLLRSVYTASNRIVSASTSESRDKLTSTQTTVNVAGGTNLDLIYKNCAAYCTSYSNSARTGNHVGESTEMSEQPQAQLTTPGCLVASYSYNNNGANNCAIYGGRLDIMSSSDSDNTNSAIVGTCEQFGATTICTCRPFIPS